MKNVQSKIVIKNLNSKIPQSKDFKVNTKIKNYSGISISSSSTKGGSWL